MDHLLLAFALILVGLMLMAMELVLFTHGVLSMIGLGLKDAFRLFEQPERSYSWWDYRMNAFRRKMGMRIDHILLSEALAKSCTACTIDIEPRKNERPSDHAPVVADISL